MKARLVAALAIAAASATSLTAAEAVKPTATLIDVHEIKMGARNPAAPSGGANCTNDGAATGKYVLTGWAVQGNKTALFNTTTLPSNLGLSATTSAMQAAYNAWQGAPTITVANSTTSSLKPTANHQYELMFGKSGGTTLAVTYTWRWSNGDVESDTLFNTAFTWGNLGAEGDGCYETAGNVYDVGNIATHEFGHTYGLDHPSGARYETMYAYGYSGETLKRSPESGDIAGLNAVY
ncbi:MAG TPA: matrixin family metalloprotease [Frankiaceae bacterium]|nr:matrixin family metalloprotease [Frankiaceae bacterium]